MIRWEAPGPYVVAFTTRDGGVSDGPYASLNLGSRGDDPERVAENRRRACDEAGVEAERLALTWQRHTTVVARAQPGGPAGPADALWSDEAGQPMLAVGGDCPLIAVAAATGPPRLAVLHAGWRGLAAGVVEAAVRALCAPEAAAVVGPAVGPCCYEVGPEVSALFDDDLTDGRMLDLWAAAERALRRAGVSRVDRLDLCTRCNATAFFSHRRDGRVRGVHGVIGAVAA